jgi:hypothetical protein
MVVTVYYDPENQDGSTREILSNLEWSMGHLLI